MPIIIITTVLGFVVQGAQAGLNALVAEFYPTSIRSTGVGWALGIGRVGAIIGPIIGGIMLSFDMPISRTFLMCSVPAVIAAIAIFTMMKRVRSGIAKPQDDAPIIMN
ncbi:hypothetical protein AA11237_3148 [Acidocella aminolytica 101 = DSM 11237]|nr:hypothetical protein AA11237_3148 [Acidocella aminolytica 101 = DSM 11237]